jgi:hypothetical protein
MRLFIIIAAAVGLLLQPAIAAGKPLKILMHENGKIEYNGAGILSCIDCFVYKGNDAKRAEGPLTIDLNLCIQNTYGSLTWMSPNQ